LERLFRSIQNRRVVDQLEKGGDKLTKAREVDHWLYFKTEKDRETFLLKIKTEGFSIVDKDFDNSLGTLPYRLHIKRVDKVDLESVDIYVIHLWELATECNGDYDGWETSVEKN
jgi:regulator of RNase E activity RraB